MCGRKGQRVRGGRVHATVAAVKLCSVHINVGVDVLSVASASRRGVQLCVNVEK